MNEPNGSDSPDTPPEATRGSFGAFLLVALLVAIGGFFFFRQRGGSAPVSSSGNPVIRNDGGAPPPTIFDVKAGPSIEASNEAQAVCANPSFSYWFEYPTSWKLSVPPALTPPGAARLLESPGTPSLAVVVIPFGLYGSNPQTEVDKAEASYLGDHSVVPGSEKKIKVNGHEMLRRRYLCRVPTAAGFDTWTVEAAVVTWNSMGYAIFLRGHEKDVKSAIDVFDNVVASFHLEKMPLRASGVAPPPSGAPSGAPAPPPSGAPSVAPAPPPSGAPQGGPSGKPEGGA